MRPYVLSCLIAAAWVVGGSVHAVDYFWNNPNGGAFDEPSNWTPFSPPLMQGPGGASDTLNFDLGTPTSGRYTVTDADRGNSRLIVRDDSVELTLFVDYELSSPGGVNPSFVVGAASGDTGDLILTAGGASQFTTQVTRIANAAGSVGNLRVRGFEWDSGNLRVGYGGDGNLVIEEDTIVTSTNASLAHQSGSVGHVTVQGTWESGGNFLIGREGDGFLDISTNGHIISSAATLGVEPTGYGQAFVGSQWTVTDSVTVGDLGEGLLSVGNGCVLESGDMFVARMAGSVGRMVAGTGSQWTATGRVSIGGDADTGLAGGEGEVQVAGGAVTVAEEIVIFSTGLLEMTDGVLDTPVITFEPLAMFDWTGGELYVEEVQIGGLINQGGVLAARPGSNTITLAGEYTQGPAGVLSIEIAGDSASGNYDSLIVGNSAFLGGTLQVKLAESFLPEPDEVYTVLDAFHLGLGSFANGASGQRIADADGRGTFLISYGLGSPFDPFQVVLSDFQPALNADFDNDGDVDGDDLAQWQGDFGANDLSDADDDGDSDGADLLAWQQQLGGGGSAVDAVANVPEPSAAIMLVVGAALVGRSRRDTTEGWSLIN